MHGKVGRNGWCRAPSGAPARPVPGRLPGPHRDTQFASDRLIKAFDVDGAVTFVAQDLNQSGATFFRGWLQLPVCDPQEMHLEGLDEKIL